MNKFLITVATFLFITYNPVSVCADILLIDDLDFGACSVILDLDHGKEFLPLEFTAPYSYNEVIKEFGEGGNFEGWRAASRNDMQLLRGASMLIYGAHDSEMIARAAKLGDWFGTPGGSNRGMLSDFFYPPQYNGKPAHLAMSVGVITDRHTDPPKPMVYLGGGYGSPDSKWEHPYLIRDRKFSGSINTSYDLGERSYYGESICDYIVAAPSKDFCEPSTKKEKGKHCAVYDKVDNDCDGLIDEFDPGCTVKTEEKGGACVDNIDNDGDHLRDCLDPDCVNHKVCIEYYSQWNLNGYGL